MNPEQELACIRAVLGGNLDAFRDLIEADKDRSLTIARSIVKSELDAKDVLQEAYIQAYKYLHTFNQESKFSTWFYRILVNQSLKWLRKNERMDYNHTDLSLSDTDSVTNQGWENLLKEERADTVKRVMSEMKPKEALILNMYYLMELSLSEIKDATGFSSSNIKVLLHRSRQSFKRIQRLLYENE